MEENIESILQELSIEQREEIKQTIIGLLNAHSSKKVTLGLLGAA